MSPHRSKFNPARFYCSHGFRVDEPCQDCINQDRMLSDPPPMTPHEKGWPRQHNSYEEFCREVERNDRRMWIMLLVLLILIVTILVLFYSMPVPSSAL